jgi:hypothetical protein
MPGYEAARINAAAGGSGWPTGWGERPLTSLLAVAVACGLGRLPCPGEAAAGQASSCQWPWCTASTGLGRWPALADLPLRRPDLASGRGHWRLLSDGRPVAGCVVVSSMCAGSCVCTTMEFWAKAQSGFGRADDGDASRATYLLGGIVCEPIPLYRQCRILGVNPALDASKASGDGVHSGNLGRHPLLEGVVEEALTATRLLPVSSPTFVVPAVQPAPGEVPSCACVCVYVPP